MSTMQRYIEQIISDLKAAQKNAPPDPQLGTEKTYEEFEEKMLAIENTPMQAPKKLFGVSFEELPPPEKLNPEQMKQITDAICETLQAFDCFVDFRDNMPLDFRYKILRNQFADDFDLMPGFGYHIDFCTGWCPECEIFEYCNSWQDTWTIEEIELERKKANK